MTTPPAVQQPQHPSDHHPGVESATIDTNHNNHNTEQHPEQPNLFSPRSTAAIALSSISIISNSGGRRASAVPPQSLFSSNDDDNSRCKRGCTNDGDATELYEENGGYAHDPEENHQHQHQRTGVLVGPDESTTSPMSVATATAAAQQHHHQPQSQYHHHPTPSPEADNSRHHHHHQQYPYTLPYPTPFSSSEAMGRPAPPEGFFPPQQQQQQQQCSYVRLSPSTNNHCNINAERQAPPHPVPPLQHPPYHHHPMHPLGVAGENSPHPPGNHGVANHNNNGYNRIGGGSGSSKQLHGPPPPAPDPWSRHMPSRQPPHSMAAPYGQQQQQHSQHGAPRVMVLPADFMPPSSTSSWAPHPPPPMGTWNPSPPPSSHLDFAPPPPPTPILSSSSSNSNTVLNTIKNTGGSNGSPVYYNGAQGDGVKPYTIHAGPPQQQQHPCRGGGGGVMPSSMTGSKQQYMVAGGGPPVYRSVSWDQHNHPHHRHPPPLSHQQQQQQQPPQYSGMPLMTRYAGPVSSHVLMSRVQFLNHFLPSLTLAMLPLFSIPFTHFQPHSHPHHPIHTPHNAMFFPPPMLSTTCGAIRQFPSVTPTPHKKPKLVSSDDFHRTTSSMSATKPTTPATADCPRSSSSAINAYPAYNRKNKSLGVLAESFLRQCTSSTSSPSQSTVTGTDTGDLGELGNEIIIDQLAMELAVERRRVYDVVNILEALQIVVKMGKNTYYWMGREHLSRQFALLQQDGINKWPEHAIRKGLMKAGDVPSEAKAETRNDDCIDIEEDEDDDEIVRASSSRKNDKNLRKICKEANKSLTRLSQLFLQVFLVGLDFVSLPEASDMIHGGSRTPEELALLGLADGQSIPTDTKALQRVVARGLKTKIRRLYDVANVFLSVGLLRKCENRYASTAEGKRPQYTWNYGLGVKEIRQLYHDMPQEMKYLRSPFNPKQIAIMNQSSLNNPTYTGILTLSTSSLSSSALSPSPSGQTISTLIQTASSSSPESSSSSCCFSSENSNEASPVALGGAVEPVVDTPCMPPHPANDSNQTDHTIMSPSRTGNNATGASSGYLRDIMEGGTSITTAATRRVTLSQGDGVF